MLEMIARTLARFAAVSGVIAVLIWLTWVLLDFEHMQSGFTLPQAVLAPWVATPPHTADSRMHQIRGVFLEDRLKQRLGERVRSILRRPNGHSFDETHLLVIGEEVNSAIDVFSALA